ncbi:MAG: LysM peptidoglycan-binding domain-containing protein [Mollicutes bacterium]|nr:LysM peptidoglycan-binding domain-containing protein [Mollicutes bacterium]
MNEVYVIDKEFLFKNSVHSITSISIEHEQKLENSHLIGEFIISGDYRLHEVSINREDFSFRVPFDVEIKSNVNLDSVELEITDFSYNINEDELAVHVEYLVTGEQNLIEFVEESDLEDFLKNNDAEIVNLSEQIRYEEEPKEEKISDLIKDESSEERDHIDEVDKETIIDNVKAEENFVTYHIHTVLPSDTIESICSQYNISLNDLKKLNNVDELTINMKLIIADEENV